MINKRKVSEEEARAKRIQLIGPRYAEATLATLNLTEQDQNKLKKFMDEPRFFLLILGNPGLGKTHICAALIHWAMETFNHFRYWNEAGILKKLRRFMSEMSGDYTDELYLSVDDNFVMFDDVGSEGWNEWREEVFFNFVDFRYNSMHPTLITSNLTREQFKQIYKPRICSRLFDKDNIIIEVPEGFDYRLQENHQEPRK